MAEAIIIQAPASKSLTHRALIAAGLAGGRSRLSGVLDSDDTRRTGEAMAVLGASVERTGDNELLVTGLAAERSADENMLDLDVGESGTTCRLIAPVAAARGGVFNIHGHGRMHERPIDSLGRALHTLGVEVEWAGESGYPPMIIRSHGLSGGRVKVDLSRSSQYLSGLLLAAPLAGAETMIEVSGPAVSKPYVDLTLQIMADFGVNVGLEACEAGQWREHDPAEFGELAADKCLFRVFPSRYHARDYAVEGDWSNASYFLAAGALGARPVSVKGLKADSRQGDHAILDILRLMGAGVYCGHDEIRVSPGRLNGIAVNMAHCPDLVPTVAVTAALAEGLTEIHGVSHLRLKESDRIEALVTELTKAGVSARALRDGLAVQGGTISASGGLALSSHGDHRLAMSLSLLNLAGCFPQFDHPECVNKSFPDFWQKWSVLRNRSCQ